MIVINEREYANYQLFKTTCEAIHSEYQVLYGLMVNGKVEDNRFKETIAKIKELKLTEEQLADKIFYDYDHIKAFMKLLAEESGIFTDSKFISFSSPTMPAKYLIYLRINNIISQKHGNLINNISNDTIKDFETGLPLDEETINLIRYREKFIEYLFLDLVRNAIIIFMLEVPPDKYNLFLWAKLNLCFTTPGVEYAQLENGFTTDDYLFSTSHLANAMFHIPEDAVLDTSIIKKLNFDATLASIISYDDASIESSNDFLDIRYLASVLCSDIILYPCFDELVSEIEAAIRKLENNQNKSKIIALLREVINNALKYKPMVATVSFTR